MLKISILLALFLSSYACADSDIIFDDTASNLSDEAMLRVPSGSTINYIIIVTRTPNTTQASWNHAIQKSSETMKAQSKLKFFVVAAELLLALLELNDYKIQSTISITDQITPISGIATLGTNAIEFAVQVSQTPNTDAIEWQEILNKTAQVGAAKNKPTFFAFSAELMLELFSLNAYSVESAINVGSSAKNIKTGPTACDQQ
jgi:hypothetical protein